MSQGQEITVTLTFRVNDEQRLRELAQMAAENCGLDIIADLDDLSPEDFAEMVITDRVGPWFELGLELADS